MTAYMTARWDILLYHIPFGSDIWDWDKFDKAFVSSQIKLSAIYYALIWFLRSNQVTIFAHMSWLLSCCSMWKNVAWTVIIFHLRTTCTFTRFGLWAHELFVKWVLASLINETYIRLYSLTIGKVSNHGSNCCSLNLMWYYFVDCDGVHVH